MSLPRRFVVEADGGSRGNPGPAGYGAVVIDPDTGETLAETAEYIGVATNNVAEYKGLVAGLRAVGALLADGPVGTGSRCASGWTPSSSWSRCPAAGRSSTWT